MKTEEKVMEIINKILEKKEKALIKKIKKEDSLREDLEMDSLDLAELTVRIEDEFGIDVFEEGIIDKVGEILEKINQR
ncbi:MAG: acyl carrier protein [Oceanotoga sp.]|jgi:acyl carrier protein|uniref:acyl carrier protein n=1 Tax=Oceanotoga sp. TaxID=2108366 RepID=UPI002650F1EA|nr:phosphopantetheine-binding protein [Oceanotoga sp.]MDN5343866.1 acyl carrier protein [Oceanotoga sp.]